MTTTTLLLAPASAAAEMVASGQAQLAAIQAHIDDLDTRIATTEATLEILAHTRAARVQPLEDARIACQQAADTLAQAQSYATLAHKTPNEQQAIKATSATKGAVSTARKELDRLSKEQDATSRAQEAQEKDVRESVYRAEMERQGRLLELQAVQRGYGQALSELGIERHQVLMQGYRDLVAHADDLHTQLVEAQVAAHDYHTAALDALKEWPELQKEMKHQVPVDDATIRCLSALSLYIETILKDLKDVSDLPLELKQQGLQIWGCIAVDYQMVMQSARYPGALVQHNAVIYKVLDAYRAYIAAH